MEKSLLFNCIRQGGYFILSVLFVFLLHALSKSFGSDMFKEHGLIENMQLILLAITGGVFFVQSIVSPQYRPILYLFSSLCIFAFIRELDSFFDNILPIISWKFCYLFPLIALVYIFKHLKNIKKPLISFCTSPAFYMMCTAMIIFIPIAQAIGNRAFISSVLPDATDVILMRRFIEESGEILAYFLLFLSSLEFYISLIYKYKK